MTSDSEVGRLGSEVCGGGGAGGGQLYRQPTLGGGETPGRQHSHHCKVSTGASQSV